MSFNFILLLYSFSIIISHSQYVTNTTIQRKLDRQDGYISIDFSIVTKDELLIAPVIIGSLGQSMNLVLDISAERTWISTELYNKDKSHSYKTEGDLNNKVQDYFSYKGILSQEEFEIDDKKLRDFDFLLVDTINNNVLFKGVISLGREYDKKKYSIVYKLSSLALTFYNTFVLKISEGNKGQLIIGDLSEELKDHSKQIQSCVLITTDEPIKWSCELTNVFAGSKGDSISVNPNTNENEYIVSSKSNKIQSINKPAYFETIYNKIYVPKDFIQYLKKNIFIDMDRGTELCKLIENDSLSYFTCTKAESEKVVQLNFVFSNKLALSLPQSSLFDCNGDKCDYQVMYKRDNDKWIMGLPILKTYQMIFDYNSKEMSFYSQDYKSYVRIPSNEGNLFTIFLLYLFIFIVILIILSVCFIYCIRRKNKRRKLLEQEIYDKF